MCFSVWCVHVASTLLPDADRPTGTAHCGCCAPLLLRGGPLVTLHQLGITFLVPLPYSAVAIGPSKVSIYA